MSLFDLFQSIRHRTEEICAPLQTEDYVPQPVDFVSPPKWHLAHTTWFFEEMILKSFVPSYQEFNESYGFLFNSYYNTVGERSLRADRGNITRPSVKEIYDYRVHVNHRMELLLKTEISAEIRELIELGLNHEQQHQELLFTDLKYTLGHNPTFPVYEKSFDIHTQKNEKSGWITIPEGIYEIGFNEKGFSFDNELGNHKVYATEFQIENRLITNGEYIEFIESDGYREFRYWLDEGWTWVNEKKINAPMYWHKINNKWHHYTFSGLKPIDSNAILAHISFYEANAFAAYKGLRLPTEFEWEIASEQLDWGQRWEWTNSAYLPYPKFNISSGAVGEYNGKFMINQMVLRGASAVTAKDHSRKTYRNFFHPHYQWQFTGIRLAK